MALIVQKYGGSSVADVEKIRGVAAKIAERRKQEDELVIVVSAMGDTTDELLDLARRITSTPSRRELDMLLTAGERISMALLSMALHELGVPAISFTGSQSGIITSDDHANASIVEVRPDRIRDELAGGRVVIVAGYQGVSRRREVTTLGRGGSDTSAVALAAALNADACEIYSDVDGVFTADPRVVPQARRLAEISYQEMQTMAGSGARVLNAQAVEFARRAGIAIHARATAGGEGTLIRGEPEPDRLAAVCGRKDLVRLTLRPARRLPELLDLIEACHADPAELWCDTAQGHATALVSCENLHDAGSAAAALTERLPELDADEATGTVCIVGACSGRAARLRAALRALSDAGLTPSAVSADPLRTLFVLPSAQIDDAVRLLHLRLIERDS